MGHRQVRVEHLEEARQGRDRVGAARPGDLQRDQHQGDELPDRPEQGAEAVVQGDEHQRGQPREPEHQRQVVDGEADQPVQSSDGDQRLDETQQEGGDEPACQQSHRPRPARHRVGGERRHHQEDRHAADPQADREEQRSEALAEAAQIVLALEVHLHRVRGGPGELAALLVGVGGDVVLRVGQAVGELGRAVVELLGAVVQVGRAVGELRRAVVHLAGAVGELGRAVREGAGAVGELLRPVAGLARLVGERAGAVPEGAGAVGELISAVAGRADAVGVLGDAGGEVLGAVAGGARRGGELVRAGGDLAGAGVQTVDVLHALVQGAVRLGQREGGGAGLVGELRGEVGGALAGLGRRDGGGEVVPRRAEVAAEGRGVLGEGRGGALESSGALGQCRGGGGEGLDVLLDIGGGVAHALGGVGDVGGGLRGGPGQAVGLGRVGGGGLGVLADLLRGAGELLRLLADG